MMINARRKRVLGVTFGVPVGQDPNERFDYVRGFLLGKIKAERYKQTGKIREEYCFRSGGSAWYEFTVAVSLR